MGIVCCACKCVGNLFRVIATQLLCLAQLALCVAVVCIIAIKLSDYTVTVNGSDFTYSCLLQPDSDGHDVCVYGYVASGVSMVATLFVMITVCWTCSCYTIIGQWVDLVLSVLAVLWWIAAAAVFSAKGSDTTGETDLQQQYRTNIYGLSWGMVGLWGVFAAFSLIRVLYTVCSCCACCCCGDDDGKDKKEKRHSDPEVGQPAPVPHPMAAPQPYSAPYTAPGKGNGKAKPITG